MVPFVLVVGKKKSGKTSFLERIIAEFVRRGYKVGTVKHAAHNHQLDQPHKDSFRHAQAGAKSVVVSSPSKVALFKEIEKGLKLREIISTYCYDVDIVFAEGFSKEEGLKIEVSLSKDESNFLCREDELLLCVKDGKCSLSVPCFSWNEIKNVADFIEKKVLLKRG